MPAIIVVVGDVMNDLVVHHLGPARRGSDTPASIVPRPGGSGANQAAWLGINGTPVRFAGRVGAADAVSHETALRCCGVLPTLAVDHDHPTGTIVVVVGPDGDRDMYTDRGANRHLAAADLPATLLDGAALLHLSGYALFEPGPRTAVQALMDHARRRGLPISVDPSSAGYLQDVGAAAFARWTAQVRLLLANADEAEVLTGRSDPAEALADLLTRHEVVVVTLGGQGALIGRRGEPSLHVPARDLAALDTTGAGDAFTAGFLAAWVHGDDLAACAGRAVRLAAHAVRHLGGRPDPAHPRSTAKSRQANDQIG